MTSTDLEPTPATRRHARRRVAVLIVVAVTAFTAIVAAPLGAHAALLSMTPEAGSTLVVAPTEVELVFNETVSGTSDAVRVFDPSGRELSGIVTETSGSTVTAALPELTADGSYTVGWKVVSGDGHPIRGAYLFHLRVATLTEPVDVGDSGAPLYANVLRALGAAVALASIVIVAGVALGAVSRHSTLARGRWILVLCGTAAMFVGSLAVVGGSPSQALEVTLDTTSGRVAALSCVVALVGLVVSRIPRLARLELSVAAGSVLAISLQGHAVSLPPVSRAAPLTVAHVVAAVVWGSALLWLDSRCRRAEPAEVGRDVAGFSRLAMAAVVVLALSGGLLVLDRVPLDELTSSTYGRLSLVKVAMLVVAVAVAVRNRYTIAPRLVGRPPVDAGWATLGRLRSAVRVEIVVLALALLAGAALSQVSPPNAVEGAAPDGVFMERAAFGDGEVELSVEPATRGTNEVHVTALGADGRLMGGIEDLVVTLTLPEDDLGPFEPEMQFITTGHSMSYADFPLSGTWTVEVTARLDRFEQLSTSFEVPIDD